MLLIVIIVPLSLGGYIYFRLSKATDEIKETGVTNILLLGTDGRAGDSAYRSDCMMILTLDNDNDSVKLTSLARDTYVQIPGQGGGKLNASYFWGKEQLLFKTIENEFDLEIDKYVQIDFDGLVDAIDLIQGVDIELTEAEAKYLKLEPGDRKSVV